MITCGQQLEDLRICGKPAKRRAKLPWDPDDHDGCCEECLAEYVQDKVFTADEAEQFFPIVSAEVPS
jgi:hypothetical protein